MSNLINGPWSTSNGVYFSIHDADGGIVADTCSTSCSLEPGGHKTDPRTLAVTNLIAASPDMHDALADLLSLLMAECVEWGHEEIRAAQDALAKARGES